MLLLSIQSIQYHIEVEVKVLKQNRLKAVLFH